MGDIFLSVRGRVLLNVEALNMTESVGNYVKHRRVPVILPSNGYTVYFVPAISGESIAHGFQETLAKMAKRNGLNVCKLCEKGIFLKSTNVNVLSDAFLKDRSLNQWLNFDSSTWENLINIKKKKEKNRTIEEKNLLQKFESKDLPNALETAIIRDCIVEDVGGFMYAEKKLDAFSLGGVKRTSNFYTGYMIPVKEALENTVIEPQLHSRYALGTSFVQEQGQMIYYVELSSAVYTFSFDLDTRYIGKTTFSYGYVGNEVVDDRIERIKVTLDAVKRFLIEFTFGAKKTRFLPVIEWESLVMAISDDIWTVPCSSTKKYIENAEKKKKKVNYNTELFVYPKDGNLEEVIVNAIEKAKEKLGKNKK